MAGHGDPTAELRARIRDNGPVTFNEFHEVALYWPNSGYYTSRDSQFIREDFYTAPLTHPVFGALLGRQLIQFWHLAGAPAHFTILEPGAGSGQLSRDIYEHIQAIDPACSLALRYVGIDLISPVKPLPASIQWLIAKKLPVRGFEGCVIANEFMDAMPVHRVVKRDGKLWEVLVSLDECGRFIELMAEPSTRALEHRFETLGIDLTEGYRTEVNLRLEGWLTEIYETLNRGYVLLIDYGHEASTLYNEVRRHGTLRCYYRHTLNANPYQHVGKQDISVHVDFTSVRLAAEALGFMVAGYSTQREFLLNLGWSLYRADITTRPELLPRERQFNLRAIDSLVDPEGMGEFKVMVLSKGMPLLPLKGFMVNQVTGQAHSPIATINQIPS